MPITGRRGRSRARAFTFVELMIVDEGMLKDQFDSGGGSGVAGGGGAPPGQGYVFSYSPPTRSGESPGKASAELIRHTRTTPARR